MIFLIWHILKFLLSFAFPVGLLVFIFYVLHGDWPLLDHVRSHWYQAIPGLRDRA